MWCRPRRSWRAAEPSRTSVAPRRAGAGPGHRPRARRRTTSAASARRRRRARRARARSMGDQRARRRRIALPSAQPLAPRNGSGSAEQRIRLAEQEDRSGDDDVARPAPGGVERRGGRRPRRGRGRRRRRSRRARRGPATASAFGVGGARIGEGGDDDVADDGRERADHAGDVLVLRPPRTPAAARAPRRARASQAASARAPAALCAASSSARRPSPSATRSSRPGQRASARPVSTARRSTWMPASSSASSSATATKALAAWCSPASAEPHRAVGPRRGVERDRQAPVRGAADHALDAFGGVDERRAGRLGGARPPRRAPRR